MEEPFQRTSAWWGGALFGALFALVATIGTAVRISERHYLLFVPPLAILAAYIVWQSVVTLRPFRIPQSQLR
jgi:hypothetical protein